MEENEIIIDEIEDTEEIEDIQETEPAAPVLRSPLVVPTVTNQVTNGFVNDVKGYATDLLSARPDSQYMLFGNADKSWVFVMADKYDADTGVLSGDCIVYHIYRSTYIQNQPYETWFLDYDKPQNYTVDDNTESYLYYASFGNMPRLKGVYEDAQIFDSYFFHSLLFAAVVSVVLQQIFRRFG